MLREQHALLKKLLEHQRQVSFNISIEESNGQVSLIGHTELQNIHFIKCVRTYVYNTKHPLFTMYCMCTIQHAKWGSG